MFLNFLHRVSAGILHSFLQNKKSKVNVICTPIMTSMILFLISQPWLIYGSPLQLKVETQRTVQWCALLWLMTQSYSEDVTFISVIGCQILPCFLNGLISKRTHSCISIQNLLFQFLYINSSLHFFFLVTSWGQRGNKYYSRVHKIRNSIFNELSLDMKQKGLCQSIKRNILVKGSWHLLAMIIPICRLRTEPKCSGWKTPWPQQLCHYSNKNVSFAYLDQIYQWSCTVASQNWREKKMLTCQFSCSL